MIIKIVSNSFAAVQVLLSFTIITSQVSGIEFENASLYYKNYPAVPRDYVDDTGVMGEDLTIGRIEHQILRKNFNDPRIHMALVCAAMGCRPLPNEPYLSEKLDLQLDDQSRKFLSNPKKFSAGKNTLYLSPVLKWFAKDFLKTCGVKGSFAGYKGRQAAALRFIAKYLSEDDKKWIKDKKRRKIKYLKYDWSLNEQQFGN